MTSTQEQLRSPDDEPQDKLPTVLSYGPGNYTLPQYVNSKNRYRHGLPAFVSEGVLAELMAEHRPDLAEREAVMDELAIDTQLPDMIDEQEFLDAQRNSQPDRA